MKLLLAVVAAFLVMAGGSATLATAQGLAIKGQVLEVKDVDSYTYLRLKTKEGETWAAVGKAPVKKGSEVTIENVVMMSDFESKTLKRKFDKIAFGNLAGAGAAAAGAGMGPAHGQMTPAADVGDVKVPKATGPDARTVAEVVTKRAELKDKPVTIRGKVVKFTGGVMGKNWLHLRDGSGSAADRTDDLVVTTLDETKIGDVVVVKGVVRTDINLGSGYAYNVLVEDAKLQK